jgi:hypothetical protein
VGTRSRRITDWEAELERVGLNIAAAEQTIEDQRKNIDRLSPGGCARGEAKRQLEMMITILKMMKHYQVSIEWHLSDGFIH